MSGGRRDPVRSVVAPWSGSIPGWEEVVPGRFRYGGRLIVPDRVPDPSINLLVADEGRLYRYSDPTVRDRRVSVDGLRRQRSKVVGSWGRRWRRGGSSRRSTVNVCVDVSCTRVYGTTDWRPLGRSFLTQTLTGTWPISSSIDTRGGTTTTGTVSGSSRGDHSTKVLGHAFSLRGSTVRDVPETSLYHACHCPKVPKPDPT